MTWTSIPHGDMLKALNHLHSKAVFNAAVNIAQRPDVTIDELRELLGIIEQEVANILSCEKRNTCKE